ncbi:PEP-CTERM sorting domain-containing protein [Methylobacter sp. S3L5C]|uniref:PEP-CTERM sorting domain-containing protein n=1 Tax=Methylobacter sp. S3L5C TaxID=2839024 RepID=UPI001FAD9B97|nr:PEP-CTERM sorting domain-containing protein [Methylobacter sp. S3L5C]UOA09805.1 PEP-CTERM sorting domain-containing protein [Methylobacter sp. S3L5C]
MNRFSRAAASSFCWVLMIISPISEASTINYTFFGVTNSSELAGEEFSRLFSYDSLIISNKGEASIESSELSSNPKNPAFDIYTALKQSSGISKSTTNFFESLFTGLSYSSNIITGRPTLSQANEILPPLPTSLANKPTLNQAVTKKSGGGGNNSGVGGSGGGNPYTNLTSNPVDFSVVVPSVPVPGAIWLFGSGLAVFGIISRRKRQTPL